MSSDEDGDGGGNDEIRVRHRNEKKELRAKILALKKSAKSGNKQKQKETNAECEKMEKELIDRHKAELAEAENAAKTVEAQPTIELKSLSAALPAKSGDEGTSGGETGKSDAEESASGFYKEKKISNKAAKRQAKKKEADSKWKNAVKEDKVAAKTSEKQVEKDIIKAMLAEKNLIMVDIPPDGDCMYHAISNQLYYIGIDLGESKVRLACADYLKQHREDFEAFIDGDADDPEKNWENYIKGVERRAEQGGVWGGELELTALSKAFQRVIEVFKTDGLRRFGEEFASPTKHPIRIVYLRYRYSLGEHYNSTARIH